MGRIYGRIYLMFGPFTRLPLTHVVNCADCLVVALESRASIGEAFNIIDGDDIRVLRYVREYRRRTGRRGILLPIPYRLGLVVAKLATFVSRKLFGKKGQLPSLLMPRRFEQQFKPIRFRNRKLKDKLSWKPPLSFEECLNITYGRTEQNGQPAKLRFVTAHFTANRMNVIQLSAKRTSGVSIAIGNQSRADW